jgi:DNA-binding NarL/FixJ family response regulator
MARHPPRKEPIRTLLVLDWTPHNRPLVHDLGALPYLDVVGGVWTPDRLQWFLYTAGVELAFLDLDLAAMAPAEACRAIKGRLLSAAVIVLADEISMAKSRLVRDSGADAVVLKSRLAAAVPVEVARLFPGRVPRTEAARLPVDVAG